MRRTRASQFVNPIVPDESGLPWRSMKSAPRDGVVVLWNPFSGAGEFKWDGDCRSQYGRRRVGQREFEVTGG